MEIYPHLLARMVLASFVVGAVLGGVYDLIRIFRIIRACGECPQEVSPVRLPQRVRALIGRDVFPLGHRKKGRVGRALSFIALLVEDLIFFALVGCAIAVLIYCSNDGDFRILSPFGVAVGFLRRA